MSLMINLIVNFFLDGSEMYYMPDSLLPGRLGIGTKPISYKKANECENQEDDSSIIRPAGDNSHNNGNVKKRNNEGSDVNVRGMRNKSKIKN